MILQPPPRNPSISYVQIPPMLLWSIPTQCPISGCNVILIVPSFTTLGRRSTTAKVIEGATFPFSSWIIPKTSWHLVIWSRNEAHFHEVYVERWCSLRVGLVLYFNVLGRRGMVIWRESVYQFLFLVDMWSEIWGALWNVNHQRLDSKRAYTYFTFSTYEYILKLYHPILFTELVSLTRWLKLMKGLETYIYEGGIPPLSKTRERGICARNRRRSIRSQAA